MKTRGSVYATCLLLLLLPAFFLPASEVDAVLSQVQAEEMWRVVEVFSKLDRTSSGPGERRAAEYLQDRLDALGVSSRLIDVRSYLSIPVSASLEVASPSRFSVPCLTPSFSASTGEGPLVGRLAPVGPEDPGVAATRSEDLAGEDLRGKIVLIRGYPTPRLIRDAERAGAAGAVCMAPSSRLAHMIVSSVWGHPTLREAELYPRIPVVTVNQADGARLESLAREEGVEVRLTAQTDTGWKTVPLLVAEVKGAAEPDRFVLIGNHLDSWYEGVTDSATGNGSLLELARVLQANRSALRRSVRLAWWPGHSTGRYSGSTWYADSFFADLHENAVAYLAIDSPGIRGATAIEQECMFEAKGFLDAVLRERAAVEREATRSFRYNDESFWGIGVPSVTLYPVIPKGHPDRTDDAGGSGYAFWWHTREDSFDKADRELLVRDTRLYLALIWPLAAREVLPFDFTPVARQMRETIQEYSGSAGPAFDFRPILADVDAFEQAALGLRERADAARMGEAEEINATLMAISRAINPVLYTSQGPYGHDPALQFPLFPGLEGAEKLRGVQPGSDEEGFLKTGLLRESNRIRQALARARQLAARVQAQ